MTVTFSIRKKLWSQNHYVFATLPNGERRKIARFSSEYDAQSWVQSRGPGWIALNQETFGTGTRGET